MASRAPAAVCATCSPGDRRDRRLAVPRHHRAARAAPLRLRPTRPLPRPEEEAVAEPTPIVRMLRGDEAELFRQHEVALKRAVRAAVRAPEACIEDACSFAWLQLLRRQPDRATVFGWLRTVAIHEAWVLAARERRDRPLGEMRAWNERSGGEAPPVVEAHAALRILAELPERQRRYLALLAA